MGAKFFEGTMPKLVKELKRLNDNLELAAAAREPVLCKECQAVKPRCQQCQKRTDLRRVPE